MKRESNRKTQMLKCILEQKNMNNPDGANDSISANAIFTKDRMNLQQDNPKVHIEDQRLPAGTTSENAPSVKTFDHLIDQEIEKAAQHLELEVLPLKVWIDTHSDVPQRTILSLLRSIQAHTLDPLNDELSFFQYDQGQWQVLISIEGCSKIMNQHEQFNGLVFTQADSLIEGIPEWIECTIYRKDRIFPITAREYYAEVKGESPIWLKMPRRMLRHRALQQCVRLAF